MLRELQSDKLRNLVAGHAKNLARHSFEIDGIHNHHALAVFEQREQIDASRATVHDIDLLQHMRTHAAQQATDDFDAEAVVAKQRIAYTKDQYRPRWCQAFHGLSVGLQPRSRILSPIIMDEINPRSPSKSR